MTVDALDRPWFAQLRRVFEAARRRPPSAACRVAGRVETLGDVLRDYALGDDYRAIDWRLAARHDELRVAVAPPPASWTVGVLLDASASMAMGPRPKWHAAKRAAATLGALRWASPRLVSIAGPPRIRLATFADRILRDVPTPPNPLRWAEHVLTLDDAEARRPGDFFRVAAQCARWSVCADELWFVTDGFDVDGLLQGLGRLRRGGRRLQVVHIIDPADRTPGLIGDFELVDVETGTRRRATITPRRLARFAEVYDAEFARLTRGCRSAGIAVWTVPVSADLTAMVRGAEQWGVA